MKLFVALLIVAAVSAANKAPLRTRARVDGLLREAVDISLADSNSAATSRLDATCSGDTVSLTLTVTDPDDDVADSEIIVGGDAAAEGCSQRGADGTVNLNLDANECGRVPTVEAGRTRYAWQVTINHYTFAVGGVSFGPLSSTHTVTCDVGIAEVPPVPGNEPPAPITGENVAESATITLVLAKQAATSPRLWQFTVAPDGDLPAGVSYRLTSCTANPTGEVTPSLPLIVGGCITPKTGTRGTFDAATKRYTLIVRAFSFSGLAQTVDISCSAELCLPDADGACPGQAPALAECVAPGPPEPPAGRKTALLPPKSQMPDKLVRRVRSAKQYFTSNVLVM